MGQNRDAERRRLFDFYSQQLKAWNINPTGIFVCPLCRTGFPRHALEGQQPLVSLAHIVPKALGGKTCTLTCTQCNNGNGANLESDLAEMFKYEDWCKGNGTREARLSGVFGEVGVKFRRLENPSNWAIYVVPEQSNPTHLKGLDNWLAEVAGKPDADISWSISWTLRQRASQVTSAIYQSAYLLMFSYFGYGFSFNQKYEQFREQILHPENEAFPRRLAFLDPKTLDHIPGSKKAMVMFLQNPEPCVALFLPFQPRGGRERVACVLLPTPDPTACVPPAGTVTIQGVVIPYRPEVLATNPLLFLREWRRINGPVQRAQAVGE